MFCVQCGGDVPAGSRFCPRCGRAAPEAATDGPASVPGSYPPSAPPPGPPTMPPPPPPPPPVFGSPPPPYGYGQPGTYPPPPPYGANPNPGGGPVAYGLANYGQRIGGYLIDGVIIWAILIFGFMVVGFSTPASTYDNPNPSPAGLAIVLMLLTWVAAAAYPVIFEGRPDGQTLGKKAVGIRVVRRANGGPLGFGLALGRLLARFVEGFTFGLGLLWAAWDPQHQTFHDKMAGTLVVRSEVYPPPGKTAPGYQQPAPPPSPYQTG
jgi:uncharacterized RDD family membrane protein YckC